MAEERPNTERSESEMNTEGRGEASQTSTLPIQVQERAHNEY